MDLKQNTEFILTKIDSLMQGAMPYLEKGGEEIIKYQVILFRSTYFAMMAGYSIGCLICYKGFMHLFAKGKEAGDLDEPQFIMPLCLIAFLGSIVLIGGIIDLSVNVPKFVVSFTSPEMFAIMELLGK